MLKTQSSDWIKILWTENGGGGSYFNKRRHRCHALEERKKDRDISISGQQAILLQITGIVVLGSVVVFSKVQIRCKLSPLGYAGKVALSSLLTALTTCAQTRHAKTTWSQTRCAQCTVQASKIAHDLVCDTLPVKCYDILKSSSSYS